jgi:hypothetical protein
MGSTSCKDDLLAYSLCILIWVKGWGEEPMFLFFHLHAPCCVYTCAGAQIQGSAKLPAIYTSLFQSGLESVQEIIYSSLANLCLWKGGWISMWHALTNYEQYIRRQCTWLIDSDLLRKADECFGGWCLWSMVTRYERHLLKVHKRENFPLAFFTLTEPIWIGDLGTGETSLFFLFCPWFRGFL